VPHGALGGNDASSQASHCASLFQPALKLSEPVGNLDGLKGFDPSLRGTIADHAARRGS